VAAVANPLSVSCKFHRTSLSEDSFLQPALSIACIGEDDFHRRFEDVEDRLPVNAGAFNGNVGTAGLLKPIEQLQQVVGHGRESKGLFLAVLDETSGREPP
jgi:hypothetical protein